MTTLARLAAPFGAALALAACASHGGPNMLASEYDRTQSGCAKRGGILVPSGANTGRAAVDYACKINAPTFPG